MTDEVKIQEISAIKAWEMLQQQENAVLVDTRDDQRFGVSHPKGAFQLKNATFGEFLDKYDFDDPIIVMCYHGISSLKTAQYLIEQGFDNVYSVKRGFQGWYEANLPLN